MIRISAPAGEYFQKNRRRSLSAKGFSLIELLTVVAILGIVTAMIYSVYSGFVRYASSERKTAKTELDLVNAFWPLTKEIESAGYGLASAGTATCIRSNAIMISGTEVTVRGTASGDDRLAGAWGYVSGASCATGITGTNVVLLGGLDKKYIRKTTTDLNGNLTDCTTDDNGKIAYWIPLPSAGDPGCYETKYSLQDYSSGDPRPNTCAPDGAGMQVKRLARSVSDTATTDYQPVLDCVGDLDYRYGCIDANGSLTWYAPPLADPTSVCGTAKLRLIRVGLLVQSSTRLSTQGPAAISMFEDLGPALTKTVTLTNDQRYFRWKKREQTVSLRNLE